MICKGRIWGYIWSVKNLYLAKPQPEQGTDFLLAIYSPVYYPHKPCNEFIPLKILNSNIIA